MLYAAEARKYSLEHRHMNLENEINKAIREGETHIRYMSRLLSQDERAFMRTLGYTITDVTKYLVRISW